MSTAALPARPQKATVGVLYGFRALMVLLVCNFHIWQQGWLPQYFRVLGFQINLDYLTRSSYLFVDGMLLMSGFLLYLPYALENIDYQPVPSLGRYYGKRLTRILPSYLFSVLVMFFFLALPQGIYRDGGALAKDLLTHLTFTFTFWKDTYLYTPLNGALWTVAVEMQFYLVFPFLARAAQKKPVITLLAMTVLGFAYRAAVYTSVQDTAILVNQMPAFFDIYALGMLGAIFYAHAQKGLLWKRESPAGQWAPWAALAVFGAACFGLDALLREQSMASLQGVEALRRSQLLVRFPFGLCMLWAMLGAALMPRFLQKPLDNRLMRFLALISFNLYIWHQPLSVWIAKSWFPDTLHSDLPLQRAYTALCLSLSILVAMGATFGVEQPAARLANRFIEKHWRKKDHEGPQVTKAEPATDPVLLRAEDRAAGVD